MATEEQKFPEEVRRDLEEAYKKLSEIDNNLSDQSRFYKIRATIALGLIIIVVVFGIAIFAFPDKVVSRDKQLLQSAIPSDTLTINIDSSFLRYGFMNDTYHNIPIDTAYLKYRIEQARKKMK
jgi:hypothetical protein